MTMEPSEPQSAPRTRKRWLYRPQSRVPGWAPDVEGLRLSSLVLLVLALAEIVLERTYYPQLHLQSALGHPRWLLWFPRTIIFVFFVALFAFAANWINGLMAPDPRRTWRRLDPGHFLDQIGMGLFLVAAFVMFRWA